MTKHKEIYACPGCKGFVGECVIEDDRATCSCGWQGQRADLINITPMPWELVTKRAKLTVPRSDEEKSNV